MNEAVKENLIDNMTQNLATLRAKASLSQAKLAEIIGVSRQTLVAVENRKRKMSWSTFLACFLVFSKNPETKPLLKFYEISADELNAYLVGEINNLIYRYVTNKHLKWSAIAVLSILIIAIGVSRIYLGVHYTSDVLAGFLISISYLIIYVSAVDKFVLKEETK